MSENQKGRPTISKQLSLQKDLRKYYEKGISATTTANDLEVNVKTVCKYFREWSKEINELAAKKFQEQIIESKAQHLIVLDRQLQYLYDLQGEMNRHIETSNSMTGPSYNFNFREKLAATKMILEIIDKRSKILGIDQISSISKN